MSNQKPIQSEYFADMNEMARLLDEYFNTPGEPRKTGFALFVFPFGEKADGRMNYISNGERKNMIDVLKEFIARAEGRIADLEHVQ